MMKNVRLGLGKGLGSGYKNILPKDSYIHGLSAKGVKTTNMYLVKYKRDDTIEGYVKNQKGFYQWLKKLNDNRQKAGEMEEKECEFSLEPVSKLDAKGNVVVYPKQKMADEVEKFVKELKKRYGDDDDNFVVDRDAEPIIKNTGVKKSNYLQLRTDGLVYEQLYDPSTSEMPYLVKEANEEFNMNVPIPNAYKDQETFSQFLKKHGWSFELYGGGIIELFKEE